jgi:Tol biopolymer transport system component/DNA-binding winged helix-turn-helix (wHTH) protein
MGGESKPVFEFGPYRLDAMERVLMRDGHPVPLAPKTFDLLMALVERHGHLVEKERLLQLVWPDAVVEESNLSYNVSILRKTLGDGEGARLIETVPKRGYRFVAPVRTSPSGPDPGPRTRKLASAGLALAALAGAAAWLMGSGWDRSEPLLESTPVTAYAGSELYPDLSPDGNHVAFSWNGAAEGDYRIYVQQLGSSVPALLTAGPGDDLSPVWAPDGRTLAFLRVHPGHSTASVYLLPFPGGAERKLADLLYVRPNLGDRYGAEIAWYPNGQWLVITDRPTPSASPALCLISTSTGEKRMLLPPQGTPAADIAAAVRPDGRYLLFIRAKVFGRTDLYGVSLSDAGMPEGTPIALTSHMDYRTVSPVWGPDGGDIFFLTGPFTGDLILWRMHGAKPGTARPVPLTGHGAVYLSTPRRSADSAFRLIYTKSLRDSNIWRIREDRSGTISQPEPLINSTRDDVNAQFSPDGSRIAFQSTRSGSNEIWICRSDGSNAMRVSNIGGAQVGGPHWAPDGERIIFHASPEGSADLYVVNANGGPALRLTREPTQESVPSWSRNGWIYFSSNRLGPTDIWKMPAEGGAPIPVTAGRGGSIALESIDGKWLYYSRLDIDARVISLRRVSVDGGESKEVLPSLANTRAFFVVDEGVYFIPAPDADKRTSIRFLEFSSGKIRDVAPIEKAAGWGLSVFPIARGLPRTIIYSQVDQDGNDLMLIQNLRGRQ